MHPNPSVHPSYVTGHGVALSDQQQALPPLTLARCKSGERDRRKKAGHRDCILCNLIRVSTMVTADFCPFHVRCLRTVFAAAMVSKDFFGVFLFVVLVSCP